MDSTMAEYSALQSGALSTAHREHPVVKATKNKKGRSAADVSET